VDVGGVLTELRIEEKAGAKGSTACSGGGVGAGSGKRSMGCGSRRPGPAYRCAVGCGGKPGV